MSHTSALMHAIHDNDLQSLERLLAEHPELAKAKDENGNSPLLLSIYCNRPKITAKLLSSNVEVSFFEACAAGLQGEVQRMLHERPDGVHEKSHDGWTALHLAAFFGHSGIARLLLAGGANLLTVSSNAEAALPIRSAAAGGHAELVQLLIEHGCPPDARASAIDYTALQVAAGAGNTELVRSLLSAGANPDLKNEDGMDALDLARNGQHDPAAGLLLAARAR